MTLDKVKVEDTMAKQASKQASCTTVYIRLSGHVFTDQRGATDFV